MPPPALSNASSTRPKRRRSSHPEVPTSASETQAGTDATQAAAPDPSRNGASKRRKPEAAGGASGVGAPEDSSAREDADVGEPDADADANATDGGVDAVRARVRRARKTRLLSAEEKRSVY